MTKKIGVLTSGGDSSGMNAAIRAVVRTAIYHNLTVVGIRRGFDGLINSYYEELTLSSVGGIIQNGGTFLQTARSNEFRTKEGRQQAFDNYNKMGCDALVVIGGDGSFHGLHALIEEFGVQGIGIPGTIDNDLFGTEYTIGFDTAVNTAVEAINKLRDTASSHSRVFIVEVMGRHAGYIAINSGVASGAEEVFIPETEEDYTKISEKLRKGRARGKLSSILVVAEGDESGGAYEVKKKIAKLLPEEKIRVTTLGHIQRGGSPSAVDRLVASRLGYEAVLAVLANKTNVMVGFNGLDNDVNFTPLPETWEKRKNIHPSWLDMVEVLSI